MMEYNDYLDLQQPEDEEDGDIISSTAYVGGNSPTEMVGFNDVFADIRDELFKDWRNHKYLAIVGMAGVGKTTLAKKILEDPLVVEKFDYRFFVPVGHGSGARNISMFYRCQRAVAYQVKEEDLESFHERNYLIVFDDVWGLDGLGTYTFKGLPAGSAIIVTTRRQGIGTGVNGGCSYMRFMNIEESWNLLRGKVFGEEMCPQQLEKAAENCGGLPLLIVTASRTPEHWEKLAAADVHNPVFEEAFDQILEVLYPSYYFLPNHAFSIWLFSLQIIKSIVPGSSPYGVSRNSLIQNILLMNV